MSIFGESNKDKRDYGYAFGAFKGCLYLGLQMATRGQLAPLHAKEFRQQMMDGIDIVPADQLAPAGRVVIEEAFDLIEQMAAMNFKPDAS